MSERKSSKELNEICKQKNVKTLWSWSRYNLYKNDTYSYYLKYIKLVAEDRRDSIYTVSGGYCHDIIEKYYNGTINQTDMINEYEESLLTMNIAEYKYDRNDEDKNEAIANKYESCIKHFFINHTKPEELSMLLEMFVLIKVRDDIYFQGYIDNCAVDRSNNDTNIIITDYKTSTIYKGEKLDKESGQLYLYAEGIRQKTKLPLEKIKIRYLFLKYVNVNCLQANGSWKERQIERNQIGSKLITTVVMWLKKCGYNPDDYKNIVTETNSLDCLPDDVKEKFVISDCYVYLDLTEEKIDNLKQNIIETIEEINAKENEYNNTNNENVWWNEINSANEYYHATLSGYSRNLHKPYDEYLKEKEMYNTDSDNEDDEMLAELLANL